MARARRHNGNQSARDLEWRVSLWTFAALGEGQEPRKAPAVKREAEQDRGRAELLTEKT
jgi:hypothetical protein